MTSDTTIAVINGVTRTTHTSGTVQVVTEQGGRIVVTVNSFSGGDMAPTFPESALCLLASCSEYRNGEYDLEVLKAAVWRAAMEISIPQERAIRDFLQHAEGRLDMIQFTVDVEDVREAALGAVAAIEVRLSSYLAGGDA